MDDAFSDPDIMAQKLPHKLLHNKANYCFAEQTEALHCSRQSACAYLLLDF